MNDTYWEHNGQRITLNDVKRFIDWHKIPIEKIPVKSIVQLATAKDAQQSRTLSKDPIIVIARAGRPVMILDGHHRVQYALRTGDTNIDGYIINIDLVPLEWRSVIAS